MEGACFVLSSLKLRRYLYSHMRDNVQSPDRLESNVIMTWLTGLLIISIFRKPFVAAISLKWLSPLLAVAPLLMICLLLIGDVVRNGTYGVRHKAIIATMVTVFLAYLGLTYAQQGSEIAYQLSAVTLSLLFPLACYVLFAQKQLTQLFESTLKISVSIAFILALVEFLIIKFGFYTPQEIHVWLTGLRADYPIRINTFMGLGAISGLLSLCAYGYFLARNIFAVPGKDERRLGYFLSVIALITVFLDDSFLLLIGAIVVTFLISLFCRKNHVQWSLRSQVGIVVAWLGVFFFSLHSTPMYNRFVSYFFPHHDEINGAVREWPMHFSGCSSLELLTGLPHAATLSPDCNPGEFHGFCMIFQTGLLSMLPWFVFLLSPVVLFVMRKEIRKNSIPLMAGVFAFLFPLLHYSGVEMWGNNYLYGMLVALLFKEAIDRRPSPLC